MSTMTLLDDYVDALLDSGPLDGPPFDDDRFDGIGHDSQHAIAVPAVSLLATALVIDGDAEIAVAADTAVKPPSAVHPMSQPAFDRSPESAPLAPPVPPPAFVPAFVPSAPEHAATPPAANPEAAARPSPDASPGASPNPSIASAHRWLRVNVGNDSYALELLRVQEVVRLAPIVALRGAARAVLGVMNLRGRIVPVVDLGLWLDAGQVHGDERSRIVVVERDDEMIGVLVSAVEDVVTLGRERIEPPLASSAAGAIVGIARVGATPTVLLDANALFG